MSRSFLKAAMFLDNDSDEEAIDQAHYEYEQTLIQCYGAVGGSSSGKHGGSVVGRAYINRDHFGYNERLMQDYFVENPTYSPEMFRRRFRMRRTLFNRILEGIQIQDKYFIFKTNAAKTHGLTGHQKMTAALRMLAYGSPADSLDDSLRIAESTVLECLEHFCQAVVDLYGTQYLRSPNEDDVARILSMHESRGWPGMLGSLDCMHWEWKNCPKGYHEAYNGKEKRPTIILEAVASYDLWIWHAFFGMPGSSNDIIVVERSHLFTDLVNGTSAPVSFTLGPNKYDHGYYLGDDIYPKWSTIVKTIPNPYTPKERRFAQMQESQRKDVERAFGVLQSRFAIISNPCRIWKRTKMTRIMFACIILHNMIVEDERDLEDMTYVYEGAPPMPEIYRESRLRTESYYGVHVGQQVMFRNEYLHKRLQNDLMDHQWNIYGNQ